MMLHKNSLFVSVNRSADTIALHTVILSVKTIKKKYWLIHFLSLRINKKDTHTKNYNLIKRFSLFSLHKQLHCTTQNPVKEPNPTNFAAFATIQVKLMQ